MAMAVAALSGASAFAESRPANETRSRSGERQVIRRDRVTTSAESRRGDDSRRERATATSRERSTASRERTVISSRERSASSSRDRGAISSRERSSAMRDRGAINSDRSNRGNSSRDRSYSSNRSRSNSSYRQPYYHHGRVSRVSPHRGGFHVWVGGARYPFFVPHAHYHRDRFRVGLMINLGGYYNPAGYYDYYDGRSRGDLRGTVESVDYRRDTFVVRNEATGSYVTVVSRDRRQNLRPGDYVEVEGEWTRAGVFTAYDVDLLDYR
jgi:hypothetical protein